MGFRTLSSEAYTKVVSQARAAGSATHKGEEREKQGLGLDPLVDPAGFGLIRRSISRKGQKGKYWELLVGIAMLIESLLDTTGSMGDNVAVALDALKTLYSLLVSGKNPVLGRYDTQIITAIFGDILDKRVLCRSQAEMDVKIAEQMTLMVPEGGGRGNGHEDPEYGLFAAALLTAAEINKYGLKSYHFAASDEPLLDRLDPSVLVRVFGDTVFDKVSENGYQIDRKNLPSTTEVVQVLLKSAHAFFFQILHNDGDWAGGYDRRTAASWKPMYGAERIIHLPRTEFLPHAQAAIIGLTEGVLDLQTLPEFLRETTVTERGGDGLKPPRAITRDEARAITRCVAGIPIGAQMALPNFDKLPLKGALFAEKGDLWPVDASQIVSAEAESDGDAVEDSNDAMWL